MTDRLTDADLDAIEQRYPSTEAWEAGLVAMGTRAREDVPALLAEVRRLRAAEARVREVARRMARPFLVGVPDREGEYAASEILAALDGEQ